MQGKSFNEPTIHATIYLRESDKRNLKYLRELYGQCNDSDTIRNLLAWMVRHEQERPASTELTPS
jgi:hypothetical protein